MESREWPGVLADIRFLFHLAAPGDLPLIMDRVADLVYSFKSAGENSMGRR